MQTVRYYIEAPLLLLFGWNFIKYGITLYQRSEISSTKYAPLLDGTSPLLILMGHIGANASVVKCFYNLSNGFLSSQICSWSERL